MQTYNEQPDQQEEFYEDEYAATGDLGRIKGKRFFILLAYFLLMSVLMVPANAANLGMVGVVVAMAVAAAIMLILWLIIKGIRHKIKSFNLSKRQWLEMMSGYQSEEETIEADGYAVNGEIAPAQDSRYTSALVPASPTALVPVGDDGLEESIIENEGAYLSDTFLPSIHRLIGQMLLIIGMRRSGKSNLLAVIIEELARYLLPIVLFDTEDEYSGLVDSQYMPNGVLVGSPDLLRENPRLRRFKAVDLENAYQFGRAIMDGCLQVVVVLKSYDDETAALVMVNMIKGINDWQNERENKDRVPVAAALDEAQVWLPQDLTESILTRETQYAVNNAWFQIVVARGGKRGFTPILATQRYSQINKKALQSLWKFLMFQSEETDLERYEKYHIPRKATLALRQGECFIFCPLCLGFQTMIRLRYSPHLGHTPGLEQLLKHRRRALPVEVILSRSFTSERGEGNVTEYSQGNETRRLPETGRETSYPGMKEQTANIGQSVRLTRLQKLVYEIFMTTDNKTNRSIGAYIRTQLHQDVSDSAAYQALLELESLKLITRPRKQDRPVAEETVEVIS
jgi:hypothetical protein